MLSLHPSSHYIIIALHHIQRIILDQPAHASRTLTYAYSHISHPSSIAQGIVSSTESNYVELILTFKKRHLAVTIFSYSRMLTYHSKNDYVAFLSHM